jgi:hypothetical protein
LHDSEAEVRTDCRSIFDWKYKRRAYMTYELEGQKLDSVSGAERPSRRRLHPSVVKCELAV